MLGSARLSQMANEESAPETLPWDKCFQFSLPAYAIAVGAAVGAVQLKSRALMPELETILWVGSAGFLGTGLVLTVLAFWRLPCTLKIRGKLRRKRQRRKRLKGELRYRLLAGSISREEEGVRKDYNAGDIVGLNATQASRNWNRLEGPLDDD